MTKKQLTIRDYMTESPHTIGSEQSLAKAHELMMQVHLEGKAVVSSGTRAEAERDVFRLHEHGLWATMQQDR